MIDLARTWEVACIPRACWPYLITLYVTDPIHKIISYSMVMVSLQVVPYLHVRHPVFTLALYLRVPLTFGREESETDILHDIFGGSWDDWETRTARHSCTFAGACVPSVFLWDKRRWIVTWSVRLKSNYISKIACHAQGLIAFCRDNPHLRVVRFVDMWHNIFHARSLGPWSNRRVHEAELESRIVTDAVAKWIMEAVVLPSLGMPSNAFMLVLDGHLIPKKTS